MLSLSHPGQRHHRTQHAIASRDNRPRKPAPIPVTKVERDLIESSMTCPHGLAEAAIAPGAAVVPEGGWHRFDLCAPISSRRWMIWWQAP